MGGVRRSGARGRSARSEAGHTLGACKTRQPSPGTPARLDGVDHHQRPRHAAHGTVLCRQAMGQCGISGSGGAGVGSQRRQRPAQPASCRAGRAVRRHTRQRRWQWHSEAPAAQHPGSKRTQVRLADVVALHGVNVRLARHLGAQHIHAARHGCCCCLLPLSAGSGRAQAPVRVQAHEGQCQAWPDGRRQGGGGALPGAAPLSARGVQRSGRAGCRLPAGEGSGEPWGREGRQQSRSQGASGAQRT